MRWIVAVCLSVVVVACGSAGSDGPTPTPQATATSTTEPTCSTEDGQLVFDALNGFWDEFYDELSLANNTPRMQLAPRIAELQRIRRDVDDQEWPECGEQAHSFLISAMNEMIDGFIAFLGQEPDNIVNGHFDRAQDHVDSLNSELEKVRP